MTEMDRIYLHMMQVESRHTAARSAEDVIMNKNKWKKLKDIFQSSLMPLIFRQKFLLS